MSIRRKTGGRWRGELRLLVWSAMQMGGMSELGFWFKVRFAGGLRCYERLSALPLWVGRELSCISLVMELL